MICAGHMAGEFDSVIMTSRADGRHWTCPEGSPVKVANTDLVLNDLDDASPDQTALGASSSQKSFIADSDAALDFCNNPALFPLVRCRSGGRHILRLTSSIICF